MKIFKTGIYALLFAAFSQPVSAVPFSLEARSMGMGNVSVATADIATAAFANPAMLANQREGDDFSFVVTVGGFLNDNDGLVDDIEAFQNANNSGDITEATRLLGEINGKVIAPEASAAIAVGFAGETYAMAVSARSDVLGVGTLRDFDPNIADPTKNIVEIQGVRTTDLGVSFARNFDYGGSKLSVGITPKIVTVEAVVVRESVTTIDTDINDLLDKDQGKDLGEYTTFDLGLVYDYADAIQVGLVGKNIIEQDVNFTSVSGVPATLSFDSRWRAGIAYRTRFMTLGADLDLIESEPIVTGGAFTGLKTQMLALGAELNAFDFAQLRVGMMKNIASDVPGDLGNPFYTVGVGFWFGFLLDVAVVQGEGNSVGAFVQTGFKF